MERIRHRGLELVLGVLMSALLVAAVVLVWESFSGAFSDKITVKAQLSQAGDALEPGDIVTYRDVIIGEVSSAAGNAQGGALAKLEIDPGDAAQVPAAVTAVAVPASLFGTTKIELLPTGDGSGPRLQPGDVIAADTHPAAEGLQTALAKAYTLLTSVHPAQLDAALTALASALQGQGNNIGQLIVTTDNYLKRLAPSLPTLAGVLTSFATVTGELAKNAPQLLPALGSTLTIAKGILASKQSVATLLAIAPTAVDNALRLLDQANVNDAVAIFRNEVPVSQALSANPNALPDTIAGFKSFADTFAQTINGKTIRGTLTLTGVNWTELVSLLAQNQGHLFDSGANPQPYTSADCPRYVGADGPDCGAAAGADGVDAPMLTTGTAWGGSASSVGSKSEVFTVQSAARTITGYPHGDPAVTDLLLGPLLRGTVTVLP